MAKFGGKASAIQINIASTLTTVPQCVNIDHSGGASGDFESTTLDGAVGMTRNMTGYSSGGTVSFEVFLDSTNTVHQAITDIITTPVTNAWNIVIPNATTTDTDWAFTGAGTEVGLAIAVEDGIKMPVSINVTGLMGYAT